MQPLSISLFERNINPFFQAGVALCVILIISLLGSVASSDPLFSWSIAATMLLCFAVFNCVFGLNQENQAKYWITSLLSFMIVAIGGAVIAYLFSKTSIFDAKTYKWIYIVFFIGYLIFLSIARFIILIIKIARKQDGRLRGEEP